MLALNMSAARLEPARERGRNIAEFTSLRRALIEPDLDRQTARGEFINMAFSLPQSDIG
jgi:hypothetical protein